MRSCDICHKEEVKTAELPVRKGEENKHIQACDKCFYDCIDEEIKERLIAYKAWVEADYKKIVEREKHLNAVPIVRE